MSVSGNYFLPPRTSSQQQPPANVSGVPPAAVSSHIGPPRLTGAPVGRVPEPPVAASHRPSSHSHWHDTSHGSPGSQHHGGYNDARYHRQDHSGYSKPRSYDYGQGITYPRSQLHGGYHQRHDHSRSQYHDHQRHDHPGSQYHDHQRHDHSRSQYHNQQRHDHPRSQYHDHQRHDHPGSQYHDQQRHDHSRSQYHDHQYHDHPGSQYHDHPRSQPNDHQHHGGYGHPSSDASQHFSCAPKRRCAPLRPTVVVNQSPPLSSQVSVMCYNILSQDLLHKNMCLYTARKPELLDWEFRRRNILSEISIQAPDVVCLQEVEQDAFADWFSPELSKLGYTGLYKRRTGDHQDGCALFYHRDWLELLDYKNIEYYTPGVKVLDRDNVAIVAKLSVKNNSRPTAFCVATTHLIFNPKAGDVKLAQLSMLLAQLHQMAESEGSSQLLPIIICGDFNATPCSPLYHFLTRAHLNYSHLTAHNVASSPKGRKHHRRFIPYPLLPSHLGIGSDCVFRPVGMAATKTNDALPSQSPRSLRTPQAQRTPQALRGPASPTIAEMSPYDIKLPSTGTTLEAPSQIEGQSSGDSSRQGSSLPASPSKVISHPLSLRSAYPHVREAGRTMTVTTYHESAFETVDYIFYTPKVSRQSRGFKVISRIGLPSTRTLLDLGPQPHEFLSSDHLYLLATFQLE